MHSAATDFNSEAIQLTQCYYFVGLTVVREGRRLYISGWGGFLSGLWCMCVCVFYMILSEIMVEVPVEFHNFEDN